MSKLYAKVFARFYDRVAQKTEANVLAERRKALLADLKGNILEIGAGTGVNFQFYSKEANVLAIEPSPYMLRQAEEKKKDRRNIHLVQASVEQCYEDKVVQKNSMDAIVCTLVLCTIPDPQKALSYFYQWLKPDGKLIIVEHIKSHDPWKGKIQDFLNPAWKIIGEGCHLNRKTDQMIRQAGFRTLEENYFTYQVLWYQGVFSKEKASEERMGKSKRQLE